jgi:hypothetical protein
MIVSYYGTTMADGRIKACFQPAGKPGSLESSRELVTTCGPEAAN